MVAFFLIQINVEGDETATDEKHLIIVSGYLGYSHDSVNKASSYKEYLKTNCSKSDIYYLTDPLDIESDGPSNLSNIEKAFQWLSSNSNSNTKVSVYIFDHITMIDHNATFLFDDCNISTNTIDSWLEMVICESMTVILNGERSSLGGEYLKDSNREVICSMEYYQEFDPDNFNITRSLEDQTSDINGDGEISYLEAYQNECELLENTGQNPVIWI